MPETASISVITTNSLFIKIVGYWNPLYNEHAYNEFMVNMNIIVVPL